MSAHGISFKQDYFVIVLQLSVVRFTISDYPFSIFKLVLDIIMEHIYVITVFLYVSIIMIHLRLTLLILTFRPGEH
jgi:hypothetical protein